MKVATSEQSTMDDIDTHQRRKGKGHIPSDSCLGSIVYNIPQGTLLLILPGVIMLIIGIVAVINGRDNFWRDGMLKIGIIFMVAGALISLTVTICCLRSWTRRKNKSAGGKENRTESSLRSKSVKSEDQGNGVQLVGIYTRRSSTAGVFHVPADTYYVNEAFDNVEGISLDDVENVQTSQGVGVYNNTVT